MVAVCKHCKVKNFAAENTQDGQFSSCCHKDKINLPPMTPPPEYVNNLYLKLLPIQKTLKET